MARYYHDVNAHHQVRAKRKFKKAFLLLFLVILVGCAYIGYDVTQKSRQAATPSLPSTETKSTFSAPVEFFRSEYFQFQASKSWLFIASESTNTKFVYRKFNKTLIENEIIIYVNAATFNQAVTRVLPVKLDEDGTLNPLAVSEHCRSAYKPPLPSIPQKVTILNVEFLCNPAGQGYEVIAGMTGGSSAMKLRRPNGENATYYVIYNDVTYAPDARAFNKIIDTFQTR